MQNPSWPVKIENLYVCNQTSPQWHFPSLFHDFLFFFVGLAHDVSAAKHILRTLKLGGTDVIAVWNEVPLHVVLENARHKTRGVKDPMTPFLSKSWYKKGKLGEGLADAGWEDVTYINKAA